MKLHVRKISLPEIETHYRYSDWHCEDGVKVKLFKFYSVYETKCYHYVIDEWEFSRLQRWNFPEIVSLNNKFNTVNVRKVMKGALRTYCNQDKESALKSFVKRKISQIHHAETALSKARLSLLKVQESSVADIGESINCGLDDHLRTFVFD